MELSDFDTLELAKAYFTTKNITKNEAVNHDTQFGVEEILDDVVTRTLTNAPNTDAEKMLMRSAKVFRKIINGMLEDINVMDATAQYVLTLLVQEGTYTQGMRNNIEAVAKVFPFANSTTVQFNQAKGVYTEKEAVGFTQGKDIKITLIDVLPENCGVTTWDYEVGFEPENFGKVAHLKTCVNTYKLKTNNKKSDGELFVRIPLENFNFTVELI